MIRPGSSVAPKMSGPAQPFAPDSALANRGPQCPDGPQLVVARPVHRTLSSYSTCSDTNIISLILQATDRVSFSVRKRLRCFAIYNAMDPKRFAWPVPLLGTSEPPPHFDLA